MNHQVDIDRQVLRIILIEGLANLCVLLAKLAVGLTTGSLAILGDAVHSLTDMTNNIVAWAIVRMSARPADREHPYGHRKFETLAVFFLATLLAVLAFELAITAVKKESQIIASSFWEMGVMSAVLLVNIFVATWQRRWARRLGSDILLADANHTFADVMITLTVIIGWQLSAAGYLWVDRLCALAVACLVLYLSYGLYKKAIPVLVDHFSIDPDQLTAMLESNIPAIKEVKRVRSRWKGVSRAVDLVISVDPKLTTDEAHNITEIAERLIDKYYTIKDVTIHVEPYRYPL